MPSRKPARKKNPGLVHSTRPGSCGINKLGVLLTIPALAREDASSIPKASPPGPRPPPRAQVRWPEALEHSADQRPGVGPPLRSCALHMSCHEGCTGSGREAGPHEDEDERAESETEVRGPRPRSETEVRGQRSEKRGRRQTPSHTKSRASPNRSPNRSRTRSSESESESESVSAIGIGVGHRTPQRGAFEDEDGDGDENGNGGVRDTPAGTRRGTATRSGGSAPRGGRLRSPGRRWRRRPMG